MVHTLCTQAGELEGGGAACGQWRREGLPGGAARATDEALRQAGALLCPGTALLLLLPAPLLPLFLGSIPSGHGARVKDSLDVQNIPFEDQQ